MKRGMIPNTEKNEGGPDGCVWTDKVKRAFKKNMPTVCADGYVPCNRYRYEGRYLFYRPGIGVVSIGFVNDHDGSLGCDVYGNRADGAVSVITLSGRTLRVNDTGLSNGVSLSSSGTSRYLLPFSKKVFASGDLRSFVMPALALAGWPSDFKKRYYLLGSDGEVWDCVAPVRRRKQE